MNYFDLYNSIIAKYGAMSKPPHYAERHHVVPKCMGGADHISNLVFLPARVHFICHRMLCKMYPSNHKLRFAFWAMCNQLTGDIQRHYQVTSRTYQTAKIQFSESNSILHKGKTLSANHKKLLSQRMHQNKLHKSGTESHLYGKPRDCNTKSKISNTKLDHPERNGNFKGWYLTPFGEFASAPQAARQTGIPVDLIRKCCLNPDVVITAQAVSHSSFLPQSSVGQLRRDLGWGFRPKSA